MSRPTRVQRWIQRAPLLLYQVGLGSMLGQRIRLTHIGRRTGRRRRTILEVMERSGDTILVGAVWGPRSDWLLNLHAAPAVEVLIGRRRYRPRHRVLSHDEAQSAIERYQRRRPRWAAMTERMLGHALNADSVPVVEFRPEEVPA